MTDGRWLMPDRRIEASDASGRSSAIGHEPSAMGHRPSVIGYPASVIRHPVFSIVLAGH
jgi:hypothetical protein